MMVTCCDGEGVSEGRKGAVLGESDHTLEVFQAFPPTCAAVSGSMFVSCQEGLLLGKMM